MSDYADAQVMAAGTECLSCGESASGEYCAACGERVSPEVPAVRVWFSEFLSEQFAIEGRLPRTLVRLLRSPGLLSSEWLAGRRALYLSPIRLYVVASAVFFGAILLVNSVTETQYPPGLEEVPVMTIVMLDDAFAPSGADRASETMSKVFIVMVPVFALLLAATFRRPRLRYVAHLVIGLHVHAAAFLLAAVLFLLSLVIPGRTLLWNALTLAVIATFSVHTARALRRVYASSWLSTALAMIVVVGVHLLLVANVYRAGLFIGERMWPDSRVEAERLYTQSLRAEAAADTAQLTAALIEALVAHERLEAHHHTAHVRAHFAHLLLISEQPAPALVVIRQGLLKSPGDALLQHVGVEAATSLGDTVLAAELRAGFQEAIRRDIGVDTWKAHNAERRIVSSRY